MSWPITNPTYGTYDWLMLSVGMYLDFGADSNIWDAEQFNTADWIVQRGAQQFYNPPIIGDQPHSWSFLNVVGTFDTSDDAVAYDLAADFGGILQDVTFSDGTEQYRPELCDESVVRGLLSKYASTTDGVPRNVAVRVKALPTTARQVWEMIVFPKGSSTVYAVEYRYKAAPGVLTSTNLYPPGTEVHAETLFASCMSVAECWKTKQNGPMHQLFQERLTASILIDKRTARAENRNVQYTPDEAQQA